MKKNRIYKTIFICSILITTLINNQNCISAQNLKIILPSGPTPPAYDQNWISNPIFSDHFTSSNRYWQNNRFDNENKWRAYFHESGVLHGSNEHQIYQRENALFDTPSSGFLTLRAEYSPNTTGYWTPTGPGIIPMDYTSGAIETLRSFKYGYFEIKCKLPPPNCGNFPAFWVWSGGSRYSEIDIFEHTIHSNLPNHVTHKRFSGTYYGPNAEQHEKVSYILQNYELPLTEFHTYAIEWSPRIIIWYFDGKVVGEALYETQITDQAMFLKVNYAIDNWKKDPQHNTSSFPLDMVIDYVYVWELNKDDCSSEISVMNNSELTTHSKSVKKKITIGTSTGTIIVPSSGVTLRATDEIIINSNFEVPLGCEFTAVIHDCPE